ncbi:MAG: hypothetical protein ACI8TQ_000632 [Planctomycetota bacterium]|jgi:hypothetical protein
MKYLFSLPLLLAPLASCHINFDTGSSWTVDGVRLEEHHLDKLEILSWDPAGLTIEHCASDVTILSDGGPTRIEATLHEFTLGDASLEYLDGKLTTVTVSGEPAAIGTLTMWTNMPLNILKITAGAGDITLRGISVTERLTLESGSGDILIEEIDDLVNLAVSSGMGDVDVVSLTCPSLIAATGMGDITLRFVNSDHASLATGMGDINAIESKFVKIKAATGMGDIDASKSSYDSSDFDTGMGDTDRAGD